MNDTITRYLNSSAGLAERARAHLLAILRPMGDNDSTTGLTISTIVQSSLTAAMGSADSYFVVQGVLVKLAQNLVLTALTNAQVIKDGTTNVFCWYVDSAGTVTQAMGTAGATLAKVKFPPKPEGKALVGFALVTCSGGDFTGGTNSLGTAGNFTVVFCSPAGAFDASVLI